MSIDCYDMNGNEVNPDDWVNSIFDEAFQNTLELYKQRAIENVSKMTCSTHGGKATLSFDLDGTAPQSEIEIRATSCCNEFSQQVIKVARDSWATE